MTEIQALKLEAELITGFSTEAKGGILTTPSSPPGHCGRQDGCIAVKSYRQILNQYLYHPECKFAGPDGSPCDPWTRGILQRRHIIAEAHKCCGKEFKRKLEQGPVDHDIDVRVKIYENGRVAADPETLRQLNEGFSEREIEAGTGLHRSRIRLLRHGGTVTCRTYNKITEFLNRHPAAK